MSCAIFHVPQRFARPIPHSFYSERLNRPQTARHSLEEYDIIQQFWSDFSTSDQELHDLIMAARLRDGPRNKFDIFYDPCQPCEEIVEEKFGLRTFFTTYAIYSDRRVVVDHTWRIVDEDEHVKYVSSPEGRWTAIKWFGVTKAALEHERRRENRRRNGRKKRGFGRRPRKHPKGPKPEVISFVPKPVRKEANVDPAYARVIEECRESAFVRARAAVDDIVEDQSGISGASPSREVRELLQRLAASKRDKAEFKQKFTKREREFFIKAQRDKRNPIIEDQGIPKLVKRLCVGATVGVLGKLGIQFASRTAIGEVVSKIRSAFDPIFKKLKKLVGALLVSVLLGGVILWILNKTKLNPFLVSLIPLAVGVYFKDEVGAFIKELIFRRVKKVTTENAASEIVPQPATGATEAVREVVSALDGQSEIEEQGGASCDDAAKLICGAIALSAFKDNKKNAVHKSGEFLKRIGNFERGSSGLESFLTWMGENLKKIFSFGRGLFDPKHAQAMREMREPLQKWFEDVDVELRRHRTYEEEGSPDEVNKLIALMSLGHEFKILYRGSKPYNDIVRMLTELVVILRPYSSSVASRNNTRFEPHMAAFVGDPGIGKTVLSMQIVCSVLILSGLVKDAKSLLDLAKQVWQKGNSDFWNGYCNQLAFILDDMFQAKADTQSIENDYMTIVRAVSSWAFPLNMADLESKGRIYFNSKFIYATTNLKSIKAEAIKVVNSPEAVVRRFKHPYLLILKDEYKKKTPEGATLPFLDRVALTNEQRKRREEGKTGLDLFPFEWWEVCKHDFITGQSSSVREPLRDVVVRMAKELKESVQEHEIATQDLDAYITSLREESGDSQQVSEGQHPEIEEQGGFRWRHDTRDRESVKNCHNLGCVGVNAAFRPYSIKTEEDRRRMYEAYRKTLFGRLPFVKKTIDDEAKLMVVQNRWFDAMLTFALVISTVQCVLIFGLAVKMIRTLLKTKEQSWDGGPYFRNVPVEKYNNQTNAIIKNLAQKLMDTHEPKLKEVYATVFVYTYVGHIVKAVQFDCYDRNEELHSYVMSDEFVNCRYFFRCPVEVAYQSNIREPKIRVMNIVKGDVELQGVAFDFEPKSKTQFDAANGNVFGLVLVSDGVAQHMGNIMFLCDTLCVMPKHYKTQFESQLGLAFKKDDKLYVVNAHQNGYTFALTLEQFLNLESLVDDKNDVRFVNFAKFSKRPARNIVSYFIKEGDLHRYVGHAVRLDVPEFQPHSQTIDTDTGSVNKVYVHRREVSNKLKLVNNLQSNTCSDRAWAYNSVSTVIGDCGTPIMLVDPSCASGKIVLGFHIAAHKRTSEGYGAVVTQEMIQKAMKKFNIVEDKFVEDLKDRGFDIQEQFSPFSVDKSFGYIGHIDKSYSSACVTKYKPVPECMGLFGEYHYYPAKLSNFVKDGELIKPMQNAVAPYGTSLVDVDISDMRNIVHVAMSRFSALTLDHSREDLSFETAILGDPMLKLKSIRRDTASGFPWSITSAKGKEDFFGTGADYDLTTEACQSLRKRVDYILQEAREGRRLSHVFIDFLKDELRKEEKVSQGMTRLISSSPLDYTVAVRIKFGRLMSSMFRTYTRSGMCPGICAYSDWKELRNHLCSKGKQVFDGDFKGFDTSELPEVLECICDWINDWYNDGPDNARVRKVLFLELVHSRHLGVDKKQDMIYQWNKSLPSGHPLTTTINSMYCLVALVAVYKLKVGDLTTFWDNVAPATYGDDNVVNVSDSIAPLYNQTTVSEGMMELFGMVYTSGHKDGKLGTTTTLSEITFLQRGFVVEKDNVLSPLNMDSFLYTCYWCKNKLLKDQILVSNMEFALLELSQHQEEVWDKYAPLIVGWLKTRGYVTRLHPARSSYQAYVRGLVNNWF